MFLFAQLSGRFSKNHTFVNTVSEKDYMAEVLKVAVQFDKLICNGLTPTLTEYSLTIFITACLKCNLKSRLNSHWQRGFSRVKMVNVELLVLFPRSRILLKHIHNRMPEIVI